MARIVRAGRTVVKAIGPISVDLYANMPEPEFCIIIDDHKVVVTVAEIEQLSRWSSEYRERQQARLDRG